MPGRLDFAFTFPRPGASRQADTEDEVPVFRIACVADFGGTARDPERWRFRRVDVDRFDAEFRRADPRVTVELGGARAQAIDLAFAALDDFHPDALLRRSAVLSRLADLRREAADPARFAAASAAAAPPPAESPGTDLERLLGGKPAGAAPAGPDIRSFLRDLVSEHVVPAARPEQQEALRAIEGGLSALLRAVLHDAAFRRTETAWRSLHRLCAELTGGPEIEVWFLDRPGSALRADAATGAGRLRAALEEDDRRWGALLVDETFGGAEDDLARLASLARAAAARGAILAAAASPSLAEPAAAAGWDAFRRGPEARSVALALPRILTRLPYGTKSDPVDAFPFEEWTAGQSHEEAYAWSNPAWAVVRGLALSHLAACGEPAGDPLEVDDLPAHNVTVDGDPRRTPPGERLLTESAVAALTARGLIVAQSHAHRDTVRLSGLYPVAI